MTYQQAVNFAIETLRNERRRRCAFDANLYKSGVITERTKNAIKDYDKYSNAIQLLLQERMH